MQAGERKRKVRSDKKRDIKPTVDVHLEDSSYRLSFITTTAVKDVCELLVLNAFENEAIIKHVSNYFQRDVRIGNTLFVGSLQNENIARTIADETDRLSFRVKHELYEKLYALSYALDCSVSRVAGLLLYESITDADFIKKYVNHYIESLDNSRKKNCSNYSAIFAKKQMNGTALQNYYRYSLMSRSNGFFQNEKRVGALNTTKRRPRCMLGFRKKLVKRPNDYVITDDM